MRDPEEPEQAGAKTPDGPDGRPVPAPLRAAAGLVLVEGMLTVIFGVVEAFSTTSNRALAGAMTAAFFVAYGAGLVACAWAMSQLRPWSRSPVMLAQLIFLGLAWNLRPHETRVLAIVLAVAAVAVLAGLLHPRSMDALNREEHRHG